MKKSGIEILNSGVNERISIWVMMIAMALFMVLTSCNNDEDPSNQNIDDRFGSFYLVVIDSKIYPGFSNYGIRD